MKFSLVNGERREAEKGLLGSCIGCGQQMIAKCGQIKVKHWAHKSKCQCDHWWENETEWHRKWKNHFPVECQEGRFQAENGEWHIADVKTLQGWVLEFQNSPISIEERESRDAFYKKIVWVVNSTRLKRDKGQFFKFLEDGIKLCENPKVTKVFGSDSSLVQKWSSGRAPVFFDFGEDEYLWCLYPTGSPDWCFVAPISRAEFIEWHQGGEDQLKKFIGFLQALGQIISAYVNHLKAQQRINLQRQMLVRPMTEVQRRLAWQRRFRRL